MIYKIYYEETIKRTNSVTVETDNEEQGEMITNKLNENASNYDHPDCIFEDLRSMNVDVIQTCDGAEECEYEII